MSEIYISNLRNHKKYIHVYSNTYITHKDIYVELKFKSLQIVKSASLMNKRPLYPHPWCSLRGFFDERVRVAAAMNTRIKHLKFGNTPEENCETPRIHD